MLVAAMKCSGQTAQACLERADEGRGGSFHVLLLDDLARRTMQGKGVLVCCAGGGKLLICVSSLS